LWLEGTLSDGAFEVSSTDDATAHGSVDATTATGSVTLADGTTLELDLDQARLPAGLYERLAVEDGRLVAARTFVLPDGTAKGKKGETGIGWTDADRSIAPWRSARHRPTLRIRSLPKSPTDGRRGSRSG
jgi:hypothetical protein